MSSIDKLKLLQDGEFNLQNHEMEFAIKTLNFLMIINGGAVVAMLAFLGNLIAAGKPINSIFVDSLTFFIMGIGLTVLTSLLFYCKQYFHRLCYKKIQYDDAKEEAYKEILLVMVSNIVALIAFLFAFIAFGAGAFLARKGFLLFIVK